MREICHFHEIESGGVDFMRSTIGFHETVARPGEQLPCTVNVCPAGPAFAAMLRTRLESGGQPVEGAASLCAASLARVTAPRSEVLSPDASTTTYGDDTDNTEQIRYH